MLNENPILKQVLMIVIPIVLLLIGYFIRKFMAEGKVRGAEQRVTQILNQADKEVEAKRKES